MFFRRKLTLRKIHELYLLLNHCIPEKEMEYLVDEIAEMLGKARPGTLVSALDILYGRKFEKESDITLLIRFIKGLKENHFFDYVHFIRGLSARNPRSHTN